MRQRAAIFDVIVPLVIFLIGFAYFYAFRRLGWFMADEGVLYYHYLRTYQGQLPYRDFFTGYSPLGYYLHAWIFAHFGISVEVVRTFMAAVNAATAAGLYVVARRVAPLGYILIPPALFLVMQPGDIVDMVFHNSPYPSWYAITFTVWGTWSMLRFLESGSGRRGNLWLLATGILGGLALLMKQNTGVFFLWGASAFLASHAEPQGGRGEKEAVFGRALRVGYLALIPVATVVVIKSFIGPMTLILFVLPITVLSMIGAKRLFGADASRAFLVRLLWLAAGVAAVCTPWVIYFSGQMGLAPFLRAVFLIGAAPDKNLYIPFSPPAIATVLLLAPLALFGALAWSAERSETARLRKGPGEAAGIRSWLIAAVLIAVGALVGGILSQQAVVARLFKGDFILGNIQVQASMGLDNLAAYLSILVLAGALVMVWRHVSAWPRSEVPQSEKYFCVVWIAAALFLQYFPRMDSAHLVSAAPLLYVAGVALIVPLRNNLHLIPGGANSRAANHALHAVLLFLTLFIVGVKSVPKVYSLVMIKQTPSGVRLVPTPSERLHFDRANLYFPIYGETKRRNLRAFRDLINYLESGSTARDSIFAFPALPMTYFLSQRDNPTRHDYFLGNNVSFREQIEVIRTLEEKKVPIVVVPNNPGDYFVGKGRDFTRLIWGYLEHRYYLARRFGTYDVMKRFTTTEEASARPSKEPAPE